MIIPTIDLMNGKIVQLEQGKKKIIEIGEPLEFAKKFSGFEEVQVIDLDAAMGKGSNEEIGKQLCKIVKARVGGGIRTIEAAEKMIGNGAKKVIIGTMANKEFLEKLGNAIGKGKIIVALDAKKGKIAVEGWTKETKNPVIEKAKELEGYCSEFLFTCIDKEGLMKGIDSGTAAELARITKNKIGYAGGISEISECEELEKNCINTLVGMAFYTGKIKLEEMLEFNSLDFCKGKGLMPTIVQDCRTNAVLMLAYMSRESLRKTLELGKACYFSRSRQSLWLKGETSGNFQIVKEILADCDSDTILIKVEQVGNACHTNNYSCFFKNLGGKK